MADLTPDDLNAAPIIGERPKIILFHAQALVQCVCRGESVQLLLINGVENYTTCPRCKRMLCIHSLGNFNVELKVVEATPSKNLM